MTVWITRGDPAGRLAVKDNIDVVGLPTTAACPAFAYRPERTATAVQRLIDAGWVVGGKVNLDQFATGLVGTRSPYGAVESPVAPGYVSGGSSSGSAAAVATGEADLAVGTDTAGSGRVPAAFCGVVGLKPTPGWVPTDGVVPTCRSIDCVTTFARDVATAAAGIETMADPLPAAATTARPVVRVERIGIPAVEVLERWCAPAVVAAFRALDLPFEVVEVDIGPYLAAGELLYGGAFVAERYEAVGAFVDAHRDEVDPSVGTIISAAGRLPAHALAADRVRLARLRGAAEAVWDQVDAVVVPTAPDHPTIAAVTSDPIGVNASLGRFTNGCNLLGWCAAAVPAGTRGDGLPFGVTVLGPAWTDRAVWTAGAAVAGMAPPAPGPSPVVHLAVCGAHLEGQPLHGQLASRGARLVARTATAPSYRLFALATDPPKPGLVRVAGGGTAVEVEVWALNRAGFGSFVAEVPPPLAIGTVELADGTAVKGFVCEPIATDGAEDISGFGGWRAWLGRGAT